MMLRYLCCLWLLAATVHAPPPAAIPYAQTKRSSLPLGTRSILNAAIVNNVGALDVLVVARDHENAAAMRAFQALGGRVEVHIDEVDYFRGSIATERVESLLAVPDILDLQADGLAVDPMNWGSDVEYWFKNLAPKQSDSKPASFDPPSYRPVLASKDVEGANPFVPVGDLGVTQFRTEHPAWDGRGVTIALMFESPDMSHPSLQLARSEDGTSVAKMAGWLDLLGPDAIRSPLSNHGTSVAGVAAGNTRSGGLAEGVAPEARILPVRLSIHFSGWIEAFATVMADPRVDVVTCEATEMESPNDGTSVLNRVLDRLIVRYGKPVFWGANNSGPLIESVFSATSGDRVLSVGGYTSRETDFELLGKKQHEPDDVPQPSSTGPTSSGALKPDFLAPYQYVSPIPCDHKGNQVTTRFTLPKCYANSGGTSMVAPAAAGAAALLISAARQSGLRYSIDDLLYAMREGSRFLPGISANRQGRGLLNVGAAWNLLSHPPQQYEIVVSGPVRTELDAFRLIPGAGVGIFERNGWAKGSSGERNIRLTRVSGPDAPVAFRLMWHGNDGTFVSRDSVALPLGKPVEVPVHIHVNTAGVHSAMLQILDGKTGAIQKDIGAAIVATEPLAVDHGYVLQSSGSIPCLDSRTDFLRIPTGIRNMRIEVAERGADDLYIRTRVGSEQDDHRIFQLPQVYRTGTQQSAQPEKPLIEDFPDPQPGVWEVAVEHSYCTGSITSSDTPADYSLKIALEHYPPFQSAPTVIPLRAGQRTYVQEMSVEPGTAELHIKASLNQPEGVISLYLYDCTRDGCHLWNLAFAALPEQELSVPQPPPGHWKVLVDVAHAISGGQIRFYSEALQKVRASEDQL